MYSLYKQATVGNVQTPRPGMFDMLGRAKYDAWAKQKDLGTQEAKWQYVETLMKVLRKYSDRTVARDLVQELESYGDPSNVVMSGSLTRGSTSDSEGSETSPHQQQITEINGIMAHEPPTTDEETDEDNEDNVIQPTSIDPRRPPSALSSQNRYRTPLAGSTINMPIPSHALSPMPTGTPNMQPLPEHPTPSAFATSSPSHPTSLVQQFTGSQRSPSPRHSAYGPPYRGTPSFQRGFVPGQQPQQATRASLERAVESMQTSLAALHERLEGLETALGLGQGTAGVSRTSLPSHRSRISSPNQRNSSTPWPRWDPANMGAWSLVLQPLARLESNFRAFAWFVAEGDERSPILVMVRRLFLDLSFLIVVLVLLKSVWRRTQIRRGEVFGALREVWRALTGQKVPRVMAERGV